MNDVRWFIQKSLKFAKWISVPLRYNAFFSSDMTGGYVCFYLACYSYIADISDTKSRTKRLSLIDGLFPLGFYIGNASAGYIKKNLGFMYNFSLGMLFAMIAMGYTCIFVKDSKHIRYNFKKNSSDFIKHSCLTLLPKYFWKLHIVPAEKRIRMYSSTKNKRKN